MSKHSLKLTETEIKNIDIICNPKIKINKLNLILKLSKHSQFKMILKKYPLLKPLMKEVIDHLDLNSLKKNQPQKNKKIIITDEDLDLDSSKQNNNNFSQEIDASRGEASINSKFAKRSIANFQELGYSLFETEPEKKKDSIFKNEELVYDKRTEKYKEFRQKKIDPLTFEVVTHNPFKFYFRWDPYNGERKGIDQDGPFYFDPDNLVYYFYTNRLRFLWHEPEHEVNTNANLSGYYEDGVGQGPDFNINKSCRDPHPERYLFRLPVFDCYLPTSHYELAITMGPILTSEEIKEIYLLATKNKTYQNKFKKPLPNLIHLSTYYEIAIQKNPITAEMIKSNQDIQKMTPEALRDYSYKINCQAVEALKKI